MKYMTLIRYVENPPNALASSEKLWTEIKQCHGLKEFSDNLVNASA